MPLYSVSLCWMSLCWMSLCWIIYAECHYAQCHHAESHYAQCLYASAVMLNVVILSVVASFQTPSKTQSCLFNKARAELQLFKIQDWLEVSIKLVLHKSNIGGPWVPSVSTEEVSIQRSKRPRNPYWKGRLSTVHLLVLTTLHQLCLLF